MRIDRATEFTWTRGVSLKLIRRENGIGALHIQSADGVNPIVRQTNLEGSSCSSFCGTDP